MNEIDFNKLKIEKEEDIPNELWEIVDDCIYNDSKHPNISVMVDYELSDNLKEWVLTFFDEYTGCLNIETINDKIIECHLRLNGDAQLYGYEFAYKLNEFLNNDKPTLDYKIDKKYLIPIFVNKDFNKNINRDDILKICDEYNAISINFYNIDSVSQSEHMSRLMIFDIDDLQKGLELKDYIIKNIL